MIADDMVRRLVLYYEHRVSRLKQEALQEIIQKMVEVFPQESQQIKQWSRRETTFKIRIK